MKLGAGYVVHVISFLFLKIVSQVQYLLPNQRDVLKTRFTRCRCVVDIYWNMLEHSHWKEYHQDNQDLIMLQGYESGYE